MTWQPKHNPLDTTHLEANIVAFIRANQAAALVWANGSAMKPFNFAADKIANKELPNFPSLSIKRKSISDEVDDITDGDFTIDFEAIIVNGNIADTIKNAESYAKALQSMLLEITPEALLADKTNCYYEGVKVPNITFPEILKDPEKSLFFQDFQVRAVYRFYASSDN